MSNKELVIFLNSLAKSIDNNELTKEQLKCVTEFYMRFKFQESLENKNEEFSEADMIKFLSIGWHIYVNVLKI